MTPDLLEEGARRVQEHQALVARQNNTASGGRNASTGRIATPGEVDVAHGRILYLQDVSVSFDGFKAINKLSLDIAPGAALHHRPERRGQDNHDGHHHRQDPARRGHGVFRQHD